jgi:chromosome segregation ATPase
MPHVLEIEGKEQTLYTQQEVEDELKGLKVTNANLKTEKEELKGKLSEFKAQALGLEEEVAKAKNDKEALERIAAEREAEKDRKLADALGTIKKEKRENALSELVNRIGAGGEANEDLRDLVSSRYSIDYDTDTHQLKVEGESVSSMKDLEKAITESGRYDRYLQGSQANGGGSAGSKATGVGDKKAGEMSESERVRLFRENPEKFKQLFSQQ